MKKNRKVIYLIVGVVLIYIIVCYSFYYKYHICRAEIYNDRIEFDGYRYEEIVGEYKESNHLICKSKDGRWSIYEVKGDKEHNYVVLRSFLDQYLYKKVQ